METLVTVALVGVCTTVLAAVHLRLTTRSPDPVTVRTTDDIDAEFFRIIGREWLRERDGKQEASHPSNPFAQ